MSQRKSYRLEVVIACALQLASFNRVDLTDNLLHFIVTGEEEFSPPIRFDRTLVIRAREHLKKLYPWMLHTPFSSYQNDFRGAIAKLAEKHGDTLEVTTLE